MDLGPHSAFIVTSYVLYVAVLSALVVWLVADGRRLRRALDDLEQRGVKRRSRQS